MGYFDQVVAVIIYAFYAAVFGIFFLLSLLFG